MSLPLLYDGALALMPFDELPINDLVLTTAGEYVAAWVINPSLIPNHRRSLRISDVVGTLALAGLVGAGWAIDQLLKLRPLQRGVPGTANHPRRGSGITFPCETTGAVRTADVGLRGARVSKGSLNARQFLNVGMN